MTTKELMQSLETSLRAAQEKADYVRNAGDCGVQYSAGVVLSLLQECQSEIATWFALEETE